MCAYIQQKTSVNMNIIYLVPYMAFSTHEILQGSESLGLGKIFVSQVLIYIRRNWDRIRSWASHRKSNHCWQGDCIAKVVSWERPIYLWTILGLEGSGCALKKIRWIPSMFLKQNNMSDSGSKQALKIWCLLVHPFISSLIFP